MRLPAAVSVACETEHLMAEDRFEFLEPVPKFQRILAGGDVEMVRPRICLWRRREVEEVFFVLGFVGLGFLEKEGLGMVWKPIAISIAPEQKKWGFGK